MKISAVFFLLYPQVRSIFMCVVERDQKENDMDNEMTRIIICKRSAK